ncbi:hypothetical protein LYZ84_19700 [Xanthomonas hortorum pv. pelargonii]|uniref:Uncharacterized protein n=1 Tax=Xanthomonas hortorum pv. pelargonii TaxID=453602 RepID=A0A6V7FF48_9XANT|nr:MULTISPECIES: hypothetical protein [Xanthomonas]MCE4356161.1 hypothetical protein [Xanthomonas hortorum pv. pelargonii]MCU1710778.1 hypothetical protein [Xanthomonas hortorum pv. pelargonii]MDO0860413.1 hypothetical protein [Xanthomonas campestris pv. campestris]MEB2035421.1 hypothetical protein [Xanthomonas campestris pv. campestris]NMI24092.1 hypothetical protein [Xanthomonas hortorum pv. pelargonii]
MAPNVPDPRDDLAREHGQVIAVSEVDGTTAYSVLQSGHVEPAAMRYKGSSGVHWAVFPSAEEAVAAAHMANRPDIGGFHSVTVLPHEDAPDDAEHFDSAEDWLMS